METQSQIARENADQVDPDGDEDKRRSRLSSAPQKNPKNVITISKIDINNSKKGSQDGSEYNDEDGPLSPATEAKKLVAEELKNAPDNSYIHKTNVRLQELTERIIFLEEKLPDVEKTLSKETANVQKDFQKTTKYIMEA